jgi:mRNA-degrading endonuclease RelE of RelBE toxin-antitoxin system
MIVLLTDSAEAQFVDIEDEKLSTRIRDIFTRLGKWPEVSGVKHLHYNWEGFARIRTGKWRVVFKVQQDVVMVVMIEKREDDTYSRR